VNLINQKREQLHNMSSLALGQKGRLKKRVEFTALRRRKLYNIGFGDVMPDGQVDDKVNTNNSDLVKVLGTVISIIQSFLNENMEAKIFFTGSTQQRTDLYITILRRNYVELTKEFIISTLVGKEGEKENHL
jgi:hypothetical protein